MNTLNIISSLIGLLFNYGVFARIKGAVDRWDNRLDPDGVAFSGDEKAIGVRDELELLGIYGARWAIDTIIQLALMMKRVEDGADLNTAVQQKELK